MQKISRLTYEDAKTTENSHSHMVVKMEVSHGRTWFKFKGLIQVIDIITSSKITPQFNFWYHKYFLIATFESSASPELQSFNDKQVFLFFNKSNCSQRNKKGNLSLSLPRPSENGKMKANLEDFLYRIFYYDISTFPVPWG